jgi:hypothetical protein
MRISELSLLGILRRFPVQTKLEKVLVRGIESTAGNKNIQLTVEWLLPVPASRHPVEIWLVKIGADGYITYIFKLSDSSIETNLLGSATYIAEGISMLEELEFTKVVGVELALQEVKSGDYLVAILITNLEKKKKKS